MNGHTIPSADHTSSDGATCSIRAALEVVVSVNLYVPAAAQLLAKYTVFSNV